MRTLARHPCSARARRGAALIWVLLLTGFMAFVSLAFLSSSSLQHQAARQGQSDTLTAELLHAAEQEVLAKLHEGFAVEKAAGFTGHVAATPGLLEVRRYDVPWNRGAQTGAAAFTGTAANPAPFSQPFSTTYSGAPANPRLLPLFSWRVFAPRLKFLTVQGGNATGANPDYNPALSFNINTPRNPFLPGACLLSGVPEDAETLVRERTGTSWSGADFRIGTGQTSAERPVWVQWIPILKDPGQPPGPANPIVGRYAYWVDVENSKVNVSNFLHDLRELPAYARLVGEPDAQDGGGSPHEQGDGSTHRQLRLALEAALPGFDDASSGGPALRDGSEGPGFAAGAAREEREAWLGWNTTSPPLAAGTRVIDWSYFCAPWQRGHSDLTVATTLQERFRDWQAEEKRKPLHPWFLRLPRAPDESPMERARARLLDQVAAGSLTTFGHEEDLDPLGRPKLSLLDFQNSVTGGGTSRVDLAAIQGSPLWARLNDSAYAACYFPGLLPMRGTARSLADSLNRFAGTGAATGTANGRAALLQMLANIAEARQPATVPPVIDKTLGIVGARSMPYVVEVVTRARSLFWELPEALREDRESLLRRNGAGAFVFRHQGRHLRHYATQVTLDLIFSLVNPNPFETEPFDGTLEVDVDWGPLPSSAQVQRGTLTAPLQGRYTATSEPGKDPRGLRILGDCVRIPLGTMPAAVLNDDARPTALRISGWRIRRGGEVWHEVPVAAPGQSTTRPWWRMSEPGGNLGQGSRSLQAYAAGGSRAVGWFTRATMEGLLPDSLAVSTDWLSDTQGDAELAAHVEKWEARTRHTAVLEAVVSTDPVLGHRTGGLTPQGWGGAAGHFYGALGHTWRHLPYMRQVPPATGLEDEEPEVKTMTAARWTAAPGPAVSRNVAARLPIAGRLSRSSLAVPVPAWTLVREGTPFTGTWLSHEWRKKSDTGGGSGSSGEELPDRLAGLYRCPQAAGPAPQGRHEFEDYDNLKITDETGNELANFRDMDVEQPGADALPAAELKNFIKRADLKKGPRGFFCSAPPGRPFVSVGEVGFIHSGFPLTPILIGPDEGRTAWHLNSPVNGPPMRMLLDVLAAPRFTDAAGQPLSQTQWQAGGGSSTVPRHTWNVNTLVAHDDYMALRQGGSTLAELKKEVNPAAQPLRAIWCPGGQSYARRETGADGFLGNDAEHLVKKDPGHLQDRHIRPSIMLARPWGMWMGVLAGDFSPQRSGDSLSWGAGNRAGLYFGPALMTWRPGLGSGAGDQAYVDFQSQLPGHGRLLALGEDGREDDNNTNLDWLKGRHAADQNLAALDPNAPVYLPAHFATRLSLVPMRHFLSDLAVDFHQNNHESDWLRLKTALNPGLGGQTPPGPDGSEQAAKRLAGAGFPGGHHQSGVFYHAPMALMTNQAGVSANAFTAYLIVQAVRDRGARREGIPHSGPGHCDPDDEILAERWARLILVKKPQSTRAPRFETLFRDIAGR